MDDKTIKQNFAAIHALIVVIALLLLVGLFAEVLVYGERLDDCEQQIEELKTTLQQNNEQQSVAIEQNYNKMERLVDSYGYIVAQGEWE